MSLVSRIISKVTGKSGSAKGVFPEGNGEFSKEIPDTAEARDLFNKVAGGSSL